jgi:transposase-like protein
VVPLLTKAIRRHGIPERITIDGSAANEAAIKSYNAEHGTAISIINVNYINNMDEHDHRAVKRVTRPMLGFKSLVAAQGTLTGIELMHMLKKKQLVLRTAIAPPVWRGALSSLCGLFGTRNWRMISATLY